MLIIHLRQKFFTTFYFIHGALTGFTCNFRNITVVRYIFAHNVYYCDLQEEEIVKPKQAKKRKKLLSESDWRIDSADRGAGSPPLEGHIKGNSTLIRKKVRRHQISLREEWDRGTGYTHAHCRYQLSKAEVAIRTFSFIPRSRTQNRHGKRQNLQSRGWRWVFWFFTFFFFCKNPN